MWNLWSKGPFGRILLGELPFQLESLGGNHDNQQYNLLRERTLVQCRFAQQRKLGDECATSCSRISWNSCAQNHWRGPEPGLRRVEPGTLLLEKGLAAPAPTGE